ncbi:MAG: tetratricopeptide repeat protein, partial [Thermomicrobiales bacterium]
PLLTGLVDKSLLVVDQGREATAGEDGVRFSMLDTIHDFAVARLDASGETAAARQAHASYFLALAERAEPAVTGAYGALPLGAFVENLPHIRSALAEPAATRPVDCLRLAGSLGWFWAARGRPREGQEWLERAIAASPVAPIPVRGKAVRVLGLLAFLQGDAERTETLYTEALELFRQAGEVARTAEVVSALAALAVYRNQVPRGESLGLEGLALAQSLPDRATGEFIASAALSNLGMVAHAQGDFALAAARFDEAIARFRALGMTWGTVRSLQLASGIARELGEYDRALSLGRESLALAQR